jgi:hypothetical protein
VNLSNDIAEVLYIADGAQMTDWSSCLPEDRIYYESVADVVIDTVVSYLRTKDRDFVGGLRAAIDVLDLEAEAGRLRRQR